MFQDRHAILPEATQDEFAREEFCASLRKMFTTELFPGTNDVYYRHVLPAFEAKHGRKPQSPQEVKRIMDENFYFRGSNIVGRAIQELVWDTVGESIERQLDDLNERAKPKPGDLGTLRVNPDMKMPRYIEAVDIHVMPGNFQTEIAEDDVFAGALYDRGVYVFAFGGLGKQNEGLGVAQAEAAMERRNVRVATALAWIDLAYAERRLAALDGIVSRLAPLPSAAKSGVASGAARPAQTLQVRQSLAVLEDRRSELAAEVGRQRALLSRWTGEPAPETVGDVPALTVDATTLRAALAEHPDLGAASARVAQAEADVGIARADKRPDWGFDVAYQRRADRYGDMVSAGVTMSLPLFAGTRQNPLIAARLADRNRVHLEREDRRRILTAELDDAVADHVMHHAQWRRAVETLVPTAEQRAHLEVASYSAGRAGFDEVRMALTDLADAKLDALEREAMVARDGVRIVLTYESDAP